MQKTDLTRLYKTYYSAKTTPELVETEAARYLTISGKGDPSGKDFADDLQALYGVAYTVKFTYKALHKDFVVAKLEGLWSFDEQIYSGLSPAETPQKVPRSEWIYRLMIRLPEFVDEKEIDSAIENIISKKQLRRAREVSLFSKPAGKAVQMLHVGPFDKEPESLQQLQDFAGAHNLQRNGLHHEIYLSDFRKTAPEKLRTILREPVK